MAQDRKDLIVLGGGAAGVAASVRARQLGASVALVEKEHLGGVCMNKGCIPTKCLMEVARLYHLLRKQTPAGVRIGQVELDWDEIMARKQDLVGYLRMGTEGVLKSNGVEILRGEARFHDSKAIEVEGRLLEAQGFVVATGSRWKPPAVEGMETEGVITTDELLELKAVPDSAVVLGRGPVELEAAQYLLFLGCRVTLIEAQGRLLPQEDREMVRRLASALREQGMTILTGAKLLRVERGEGALSCLLETKEGQRRIQASLLLHANRVPRLEGLNLDRAGIHASNGILDVDRHLRTSQGNILGAGDVTGAPFYSHRASAMGIKAAENALGQNAAWDPASVPRALFTYPQMAAVGLTESQAKETGREVRCATIPYSVNAKAMIGLETEGAVKIVSEARYGEILGVHIVGPQATELISEGALAMELEATVEDLASAIRLHPSLSESQVEAARECLGRGIYLLR